MAREFLERRIVDNLTQASSSEQHVKQWQGSLIDQRHVTWKPFSNHHEYATQFGAFEEALSYLKDDNIIYAWERKENSVDQEVFYNIYW